MLAFFSFLSVFLFFRREFDTMLPLPAPQFELAVTPVARVGFWALEREPFLLV